MGNIITVQLKKPINILTLKSNPQMSELVVGRYKLKGAVHCGKPWWVLEKNGQTRGLAIMRWRQHIQQGAVKLLKRKD